MIPREVLAIARYWGGHDVFMPRQLDEGTYEFLSEDRMRYVVTVPGWPAPVYEDSGRPAGNVVRDDWVVRCTDDAPDAWWTVGLDGMYHGYAGSQRIFEP